MTRKQLFAGTMGLGLMLSAFAGCYIQKDTISVDGDFDGFGEGADCDDADGSVFPGANEVCDDGVDNDCDGKTDALDPECGGGAGGFDGSGGFDGTGGALGTGGSGGAGGAGTGGAGAGGAGTGGAGTGGAGTGGAGGGLTPPPDN